MISAVNILNYVISANLAAACVVTTWAINEEATACIRHLCGARPYAHRWTLTLNQTLL